jgi:hypothetical protein
MAKESAMEVLKHIESLIDEDSWFHLGGHGYDVEDNMIIIHPRDLEYRISINKLRTPHWVEFHKNGGKVIMRKIQIDEDSMSDLLCFEWMVRYFGEDSVKFCVDKNGDRINIEKLMNCFEKMGLKKINIK